MKAAVYVRVSTEEQVDGYSLDAQIRATKAYCEREKWDATFFEEPGRSGTNTEKRPVFLDMIARCKAHQFDVVLVHKLDRFARNREDSVVYKSLLKREGIRVISVTEQFDDGPIGQMVEGFMECIAQWYSANLSTEVKKGQGERALKGKHHSHIPFGYMRNDEGIAVIDPVTGPAIRDAFLTYAQGQATLEDLYEEIVTRTEREITKSGVAQLMRNPFYTGKVLRDGELLKGIHEPLINDQLFQTVREMMKHNSRGGGGPLALRVYELSKILRCECGLPLCGHSLKHGRYFYYGHRVSVGREHSQATMLKAIPAEKIVNHLLCRPVHEDWQYRIANITKPVVPEQADEASSERLARAKELYIAGDMTRNEFNAIKKGLVIKPSQPARTPDMAALMHVISTPEAAWIGAKPEERKARNRLLLKWVTIVDYAIAAYELTDLGKAVFGEQ